MTSSAPRFEFPATPEPGGLPLRSIRQGNRWASAQWLGYIGSGLLVAGLFLPVFLVHAQPVLLWQLGLIDGFPTEFALVLVLALASAAACLRRAFLFLALAGFATYLVLALACIDVQRMAAVLPAPDGPGLFVPEQPGPFFAAGWYVLLLGALLVLAAAGLGEYRNSQERVRRSNDDEFIPPPRSPWQRMMDSETAWLSPN